jgi:surface antigen
MGLVVFLAVVGALTIYAFYTLFDAPSWGFIAALVLYIVGMNASGRFGTEEQIRVRRFLAEDRAGTDRSLAIRKPTATLAASIGVVLGIGLGWLLRGIGGDESSPNLFLKLQHQRLLATAPLRAALETVPSGGTLISLGGGKDAQFRVKMTFRNESRNYCRQYELALGVRERIAGIACRTPSGDWSVALQSPLPPSALGVTVPASAGQNAALDAVIGALIDGAPLIGEAEAAIMRNGWRK